MAQSNSKFNDANLELHERWMALKAEPDQTSHAVVEGIKRLANDVIETNRGLLGSEIRKYTARNPQIESDLFSTAGAQLWRAFQMWDPKRSTLRTASLMYIRGAVQREVAKNDHPHLSYDDFTARNKAVKASRKFVETNKREPSPAELAALTDMTEEKIGILFAGKPVSLDQPTGGSDDNLTLGAILADEAAEEQDDTDQLFAEFNSRLEPEVAESEDPVALLAYLMRQPTTSGVPARTAEIAYMLGIPNAGRGIPGQVAEISMRNAVVKLQHLTAAPPTAEQVSLLANVPVAQAQTFLASK